MDVNLVCPTSLSFLCNVIYMQHSQHKTFCLCVLSIVFWAHDFDYPTTIEIFLPLKSPKQPETLFVDEVNLNVFCWNG